MKVVIRMTKKEEVKALAILLRHSPGTILPKRTYIISEEAAQALQKAGIKFTELSRESDSPAVGGAVVGERI